MTRSPLGRLLGEDPDVTCVVMPGGISAHWWPTAAPPGTPCLCGAVVRPAPPHDSCAVTPETPCGLHGGCHCGCPCDPDGTDNCADCAAD